MCCMRAFCNESRRTGFTNVNVMAGTMRSDVKNAGAAHRYRNTYLNSLRRAESRVEDTRAARARLT